MNTAASMDSLFKISHNEAWKIIFRVLGYVRLFRLRATTKVTLICVELIFRIAFLPWALKVVVDHVILNQSISKNGEGFPGYIAPLVSFLAGLSPTEIMSWMLFLGVIIVVIFGMTPNRATGISAAGNLSGMRAGSVGPANAELADGQDTASQTENSSNGAVSEMGGLLGLIDFHVHLRLSQSLNHLLRSKLASHITALPLRELEDRKIGDSTYRVLYDTTSSSGIFDAIAVYTLPGLLTIGLIYSILSSQFNEASELIVIAAIVGIAAYIIVTPMTGIVRKLSHASRSAGAILTSNIEEGMSNILVIQSLGGSQRESARFDDISKASFKQFRYQVFAQISMGMIGSLAFLAGQISFFILMSSYVIEGVYTAGDYFVVNYYFFVLSAVCYGFGTVFSELQADIAGMARVFRVLDTPIEDIHTGKKLVTITQGIKMEKVEASYSDGRHALKGIQLEARLGDVIAFVGPAGAGKTTLTHLIPGFLQPTGGEISIDGINVERFSKISLRNNISYVFQETQLFSRSILENICYGETAVSMDRVRAAARDAGAHNFISALPDGYDTNLGSVAGRLSVGQKQRIAIARGLLKSAQILILDEPTSALDPQIEEELMDNLYSASHNKLTIVVTHRLSTITNANKIYFLSDGHIIESGTHEELMSIHNGSYERFVTMQMRNI